MTATPITSDQRKQFRRFVEDISNRALKETAPDKDGLQRLFERGGEFQAHVVTGIRRFTAATSNYDLARTILGKDFISPEQIAKSCKLVYTDEQLATFGDTLPAQDVLEWCRENGYILVAGPPRAISLLEIRDLQPNYFYSKQGGWYAESKEVFSRRDRAATAWIMLRKESVPESQRKSWDKQQTLLSEFEIVPNAAETAWAITTYKAVRGVYLLPNVYVRTSSLDSVGDRVSVGGFDEGGLSVGNGRWDVYRSGDLGLSSARKSN